MVDHIKRVIRDKADHVILHVGTNDIPSDKDVGVIVKLLSWSFLQNLQFVMSRYPTLLQEKTNTNIKFKK